MSSLLLPSTHTMCCAAGIETHKNQHNLRMTTLPTECKPAACHATVCLVDIKYCKDTRPGNKLKVAQQQQRDFCKNINGRTVAFHTVLLSVNGTF
eukprot:scaffold91023_cov20-Tisochrysis_lutea.AAC.1